MTFAGRFLSVFLAGGGKAAAVEAIAGVAAAAGVADIGAGLETPTSAGFGDCFEHALTASNSPRILLARPGRKRRPGDGVVSCMISESLVRGFLVTGFPSGCHFVTSSAAGAVAGDMATKRPT